MYVAVIPQSSVIFSHSVSPLTHPQKAANSVITFETIVWHRKETLRDLGSTKSRRINRRLQSGNRRLVVESTPVFFFYPFTLSNSGANMGVEAE